ncbi:MAG: DUF1842 domain-containing protein [Myxococcales bacterium]|nr:DUF1842 domain-containing protein [Myxococcales bacterium]MCB9712837.1 DUF1842 domain-containing protein [Myxococcales bacterium]
MLSTQKNQLETIQRNGIAGDEIPGGITLQFSLSIDEGSGTVSGYAVQSQAVQDGRIPIVGLHGTYRLLVIGPDETRLLSLEGTAEVPFPGEAIGFVLQRFTAHFALGADWNGTGGWTIGRTSHDNVPVRTWP